MSQCDRSRTSLTRYASSMREPDPEGQRRAARQLWHSRGIATIFPGDVSGMDREWIQAIANRVYGKRSGGS